uniref:Glutathione S-transferase rho n=1 Tax=Oryzias latipes TaxID=8090 RepID=A0A3P9J5B4_ORYLA
MAAKSMTLLWGSGSCPCWRAMIALEEKNLQGYNHKLLSFDKMEHKSQQVLDINPRGQLPTFKHGDTVVNESYAICLYLESHFKSQGNQLIPDGPEEQALMFQRMFEGLTFYEKLGSVIYYDWYVPEGERHDSALKRNKDGLVVELGLWEGYLSKVSPAEAGRRSWCGHVFRLSVLVSSRALARSWQERVSRWQTWWFSPPSPFCSDSGCLRGVTPNWLSTTPS